jgi:hypothetical protein
MAARCTDMCAPTPNASVHAYELDHTNGREVGNGKETPVGGAPVSLTATFHSGVGGDP